MASFVLRMTERNLKIADFIGTEPHVVTRREDDRIQIEFGGMLSISRIEIDAAIGLTDKEWRELGREIKKTLKGAKVREFSDLAIGIWPVRKGGIFIRVNDFEKELLERAAKTEHRSISDFIRMAALEKADQVLIMKTAIEKRVKSKLKRPQETEIYG
jgi:hypothetical protein